jgi:hypothetical protein
VKPVTAKFKPTYSQKQSEVREEAACTRQTLAGHSNSLHSHAPKARTNNIQAKKQSTFLSPIKKATYGKQPPGAAQLHFQS